MFEQRHARAVFLQCADKPFWINLNVQLCRDILLKSIQQYLHAKMLSGRQKLATLQALNAKAATPGSGVTRITKALEIKAQKIVNLPPNQWVNTIAENIADAGIVSKFNQNTLTSCLLSGMAGFSPVDIGSEALRGFVRFGGIDTAMKVCQSLIDAENVAHKKVVHVDLRSQEREPQTGQSHDIDYGAFFFDNRKKEILFALGWTTDSVETKVKRSMVSPRNVIEGVVVNCLEENGKTVGLEFHFLASLQEADGSLANFMVISMFPEQIGAIR